MSLAHSLVTNLAKTFHFDGSGSKITSVESVTGKHFVLHDYVAFKFSCQLLVSKREFYRTELKKIASYKLKGSKKRIQRQGMILHVI